MSRAVDVPMASHDLSATTRHHLLAGLIDVGTSNAAGATDHDAVGAGDTVTALVERGPQVVVVAPLDDEGSLDGAADRAVALGEGDDVFIDWLSGLGVQLDQLDAGPEGSE
ncbi:hypothetical protein HG530_006553 [Fusarium avenaceum]|nr:hypothetical protein HG530_006553 [Fusarium avenaceum]